MKTISLYSIKGGVGKTATAVNLAYLAASDGARTVLIDLDPQGSASFYFRVKAMKKATPKRLIRGRTALADGVKQTDYSGLDALPSRLSYRKMDLLLDGVRRSRRRLKKILAPLDEQYDYIFLDCPPNITLVSENVFMASDVVLVPVIPTTLSVLTYEKLLKFFDDKSLKASKIAAFFSMVENRKSMHKTILKDIPGDGSHFLKTVIPYAADVEKMGIHREPVCFFRPRSEASKAYSALWEELKRTVLNG